MLNSSDRLYSELRDQSFAAVGPRLGEKAKAIQTNYQARRARSLPVTQLPQRCLTADHRHAARVSDENVTTKRCRTCRCREGRRSARLLQAE